MQFAKYFLLSMKARLAGAVFGVELIRILAPLATLGFMSGRLAHADEWLSPAGFQVPDLKIDETIEPGKVTRVRIVPDKAATYDFHCSIFCGSRHEEMAGQIVVSP